MFHYTYYDSYEFQYSSKTGCLCTCVCLCVSVIPACWGSEAVATPSVDWSLISPLPETFHLQQHSPTPRRGEGWCSEQASTGMNTIIYYMYVSHYYLYFSNTFLYCMYHLYFCTESNRFRAVNAYKPTKCSFHRWTLVRNNCLYNLYAYSAIWNTYN